MRNVAEERKVMARLFALSGLAFLAGLFALAVGTQLLVISFWPDQIKFWCWQGVWLIVHSFELATIFKLALTSKK